MELTGNAGEDPQVLGIPLPDMGTSEHAYGLAVEIFFLDPKIADTRNPGI